MKSEKAKRLLNNGRFHVFCLKGEYPEQRFSPEGKYIEYAQGASAVKLAEQEAEEQVRQKSVDAFKSSCVYKDGCGGAGRACDPTLCEDLRLFIQKLNEV